MKMKLLLIIGLVFLGVLCLCSAVNAFSITSVKVAGQPLSYHMGVAYSTTTIIPRLTFTKNPTITFTVDWTDRGIIGEDGRVTLPGSATRYFANIGIGSADELYNSKDVWLGWETGNYKQATAAFTMNDPWYGPFTKTSIKKGDWYVESIPLTPGKTSYTYTLQNPDVLCFDAHRYSVYIFAAGYPEPTQYYAYTSGPEWEFTSGDNSDDSWNVVYSGGGSTYKLSQEFYVTEAFDFRDPALKLYRIGVIPAGANLSVSLYKGNKNDNWLISGSPLWTSASFNTSLLNMLTTTSPGLYIPFYTSMGSFGPNVRLAKDTSYVLVLSMTGGDSTHKIAWRKDTGKLGFPHYTKGLLSWCYAAGNTGGSSWTRVGDTFMFYTEGYETTLTTAVGNIVFQTTLGGFNTRNFVLNTYGPSIDRSSVYDASTGWSDVSHYVYAMEQGYKVMSLFLGNMNPKHLKLACGDLIGKGASFDTAAVVSKSAYDKVYTDKKIPVTVVLCDKDRVVLDYAVVDSYLPILGTFPFKPYGPSVGIGTLDIISQFRLLQYTVGAKTIESRRSYYIYIGVPIGPYTMSNLYITTDDTMKKTNWSASKISIGGVIAPDDSKTYDYMGAYVYFETLPAYTDKSAAGAFRTTPSWVTNFVIWCSNSPPDGLGLPWFAVLVGFMPAIFLVGLLWGFMRKWSISLPGFIYTIAAGAGIFISWNIGLLALWIMVFMLASLIFISMFQFREPISQALQTVGAVKSSGALSSLAAKERRQEMLSSSGSTRRMLSARRGKDQGVLPTAKEHLPAIAPSHKLVGRSQITGKNGIVYDVKAWETHDKQIIQAERKKMLNYFRRKNQGV